MNVKKKLNHQWLITTLLGLILIYLGLRFLIKEANLNSYSFLFGYLPKKIILIRFYFSITLRIFLIVTGIGILIRKEFFRKCFIAYGIFTIVTVYWKHPLATFQRIYLSMAVDKTLPASLVKNLHKLALASTIINCLFDILLCGFFIYFLSKPEVKKQFS